MEFSKIMKNLVYLQLMLLLSLNAVALRKSVLHVSDIHLDPLFDPQKPVEDHCRASSDGNWDDVYPIVERKLPSFSVPDVDYNYGRVGCDAPYKLFSSAIDNMEKIEPSPDFVLMTGDFVSHHLPKKEMVLNTIENVTNVLRKSFKAPLVVVLGNNDFYPDYACIENDSYFEDLWNIWGEVLPTTANDTFHRGGYFRQDIGTLRLLILNSIFFSPRHSWDGDSHPDDPAGQFSWLSEELQRASDDGVKVWILTHIPPGFEDINGNKQWHNKYSDNFTLIISKHVSIISAIMFGHVHRDEFRLLYSQSDLVHSGLLTGAVSPISGNNPSYRILKYDPDSYAITDYETMYTDLIQANWQGLTQWRSEGTFADTFKTDLSTHSLFGLVGAMEKGDDVLLSYAQRRSVQFVGDRSEIICTIQSGDDEQFDTCIQGQNKKPIST